MTTITKERAELKAFIAGFLSDPAHDNQSSRSMTAEVFRIALASLDADQPVPEKIPKGLAGQIVGLLAHNIGDKLLAQKIWNACRAAMLQGVEQPQNARQNIPENIPDGNSPAIPDDWVMVPKEPTQAMIKAWLSEVANWRGHVAGYKAALAAAPKPQNVPQNIPENIPSGKSTLTPDGWISCSERMPAQDDWVLIYSKHGEYLAGQVQGEYVELNDGTLSWLGSALHWMPLPEPPQEVNRG